MHMQAVADDKNNSVNFRRQEEVRHEANAAALETKAAVQRAQGNYVGAAVSQVGTSGSTAVV